MGFRVLALQVFDQRHLHGALLVCRQDAHRYLPEPGHAAGAPAALARDDLIKAAVERPDRDRLDEPVGADGLGEQLQRLGVKALARLVGARLDLLDRQQNPAPSPRARAARSDIPPRRAPRAPCRDLSFRLYPCSTSDAAPASCAAFAAFSSRLMSSPARCRYARAPLDSLS